MSSYLYLDTETTGLHDDSQVWNLAWILEKDGIEVWRRDDVIVHRDAPSPWVLNSTRYVERVGLAAEFPLDIETALSILESHVREVGTTYLVGAVPSFDDYRLRRVGPPPWHYHLIDVETLVMGRLGLAAPPSLREIAELTGIVNARPHDAMSDAEHVRDIHHWLLDHPGSVPIADSTVRRTVNGTPTFTAGGHQRAHYAPGTCCLCNGDPNTAYCPAPEAEAVRTAMNAAGVVARGGAR